MLFRQTPGNFHRVAFRPAGGDASPDEYGNFHVNMAWIRSDITTGNLLLKEPQSGTDWFLVELGIEPGIVILFELAIELALACTGLQLVHQDLKASFQVTGLFLQRRTFVGTILAASALYASGASTQFVVARSLLR